MAYFSSASQPTNLSGNYLLMLLSVLAGYALMGKGFAYFGLPPLYIGEVVLLVGVLVLLRTSCFIAAVTTLPSVILAATMAWVFLRTFPFVDAYGWDALRDSVVVMYGGFAFIIIALLLEDARRINTVIRYYDSFLNLYVPAIPFIFLVCRYMGHALPKTPGSHVPLIQVQATDIAVHLTGAAVFTLVGFHRLSRFRLAFLVIGLAMPFALGRGSMLASAVPITAAVLLLGKWRQLALTLSMGLMIFSAAYAIEPLYFDYVEASSSDERPISTRQVVDNIMSIAGEGGAQTEGTKQWRLDWWNDIVNYTIYGPYFWMGRGFGLNIADADGFSHWTIGSLEPPLRSPHNVQMTMLARAGVPGVTLWFCVVVSWFGMIIRASMTARRREETDWAALFLFLGCYVGSIIINASFDPALEGPVEGVWFWSLIGFGIGSVMVYRHQHILSSTPITKNTEL